MTATPNNVIRFRQHWRGREPGQTVDSLDYGVAHLLVQRGIAEWAEEQAKQGSFVAAVKAVVKGGRR